MNNREYIAPRQTVFNGGYSDNRFYAETNPAKQKNISQFLTSSQIESSYSKRAPTATITRGTANTYKAATKTTDRKNISSLGAPGIQKTGKKMFPPRDNFQTTSTSSYTYKPATVPFSTMRKDPTRVPESRETTTHRVKHLAGSNVMHQVGKEEFKQMHQKGRVPVKEERVGTYLNSNTMENILSCGNNVIGQVEPKVITKTTPKIERKVWKPRAYYKEYDDTRKDHI
ncbi:unnamed protein product [Moneuplotes crassus]|uniref:Uncharacterized protein n=2 Tax=Euplotes crassus TaxID=5936 RepID=A0AAD1XUH0_EUPCR|nr:unnamed protein product [Moneuplotes crassus]